jgi:2-methylcitrate dehydratase PrpD
VTRLTAEPSHAGLSRRLAAFVHGSRWEDVPGPVRAHALRAVFNGFGTALGGSSDQAVIRLAASLAPFSAGGTATVIGHHARRDALTAAFLNAAAMNVFDFDDTHAGTIIHPTAPVAPVVLALSEVRPVSGAELLHAFTLGAEIACRIGNAISPGHYDRGWHITSTCGIFGAAVAAAKLLHLALEEIVWALGNASAQAAGLVETLGFMAKSTGVGNAARGGLVSALMAQSGVEGPPRPLEGPRGFLKVCSDAPRPELVLRGLGAEGEISRDMFKPYPCGVVLNPVIDACLAARAAPTFALDRIAERHAPTGPMSRPAARRR